ncbi:MAG: ABC transporter permease [Steroidobacteraceae bacterium]
MTLFKQTLVLTVTGLRGMRERRGAALVTVIGVTTVVAVLASLLALSRGARNLADRGLEPNEYVVLGAGAGSSQNSTISRANVATVEEAPGIKRGPDGKLYAMASTMVSVDAIRTNGKRGGVALVGWTPGVALFRRDYKIIAGRMYRPGVHELVVSEPISKMYRGLALGDHIDLRGTEWKVVGIAATQGSVNDSILLADADTVMSAFGENDYQQVVVRLNSPASIGPFKAWVARNPALSVQIKSEAEDLHDTFKGLYQILDFVAYFIGAVMAIGAIFGALNSLYASVDARRRELATLRAIGFGGAPVVLSVLIEGMLLALPGAFIGAGIAWVLFNGHAVSTGSLVLELDVTSHLLVVSVLWALAIGLIGASLPAIRAARVPVAVALRAT